MLHGPNSNGRSGLMRRYNCVATLHSPLEIKIKFQIFKIFSLQSIAFCESKTVLDFNLEVDRALCEPEIGSVRVFSKANQPWPRILSKYFRSLTSTMPQWKRMDVELSGV